MANAHPQMRDPVRELGYWLFDQQKRVGVLANLVQLVHVGVDSVQRVSTHAIDEPGLTEASAQLLASKLYQAAINFATAWHMPQNFSVELWWHPEAVCGASQMIQVAGTAASSGQSSEPANAAGQLAQGMRHLEQREKILLGTLMQTFGMLERSNERMEKRIATLETERVANMERVEQANSQHHVRELERRQLEAKESRTDDMHRTARLLIAPIVSRIATKAGITDPGPQMDAQALAFMAELTEKQIEAMLATMDRPKQIAFLELYQRGLLAKEASKPQSSPPASPASSDATNGSGGVH